MKREIESGHTVTPMPSRFRKKPVVVEAHQWFKNGDHPDDYRDAVDGPALDSSKWISFDPGYQNEHGWEGQVVRYFRHPDVPGDKSTYGRPARAVKGKPNAKQRRGLSAVMGREALEDRE